MLLKQLEAFGRGVVTVLVRPNALPSPLSKNPKTSNSVPCSICRVKSYSVASGLSIPWMTWRGEYVAASESWTVPDRAESGIEAEGRKRTVTGRELLVSKKKMLVSSVYGQIG